MADSAHAGHDAIAGRFAPTATLSGDRHRWAMALLDALVAAPNPPAVLALLAERMQDLPADVVVVDGLQPDGTLVRCEERFGPGVEGEWLPSAPAALQLWRHPSREAVSAVRVLRGTVADAAGASRFAASPDAVRQLVGLGPLAYVFAPIKAGGRVFGALGLVRRGEGAGFTAEDEGCIEGAAAQAGLVLESLIRSQEANQVRQGLEARAALWQVVSESSRVFAEASLSVREALQRVSRLVAEQVGGVCAIRLLDAHGQWEPRAEVYHPDDAVRTMVAELLAQPVAMSDGISARAVASGRSVFLAQVDQSVLQGMLAKPAQGHVSPGSQHSLMCVPLRVRGRSIGVIICSAVLGREPVPEDWGTPVPLGSRPYTETDLRLCEELADLASMAIDHARLFEGFLEGRQQAEREAARLASLQQITALLSAAPTPAEVLETLLRRGGAALGATMGTVGLIGADGCHVVSQGHYGMTDEQAALWGRVPLTRLDGVTEVLRTGEVLLFESAGDYVARYPWAEAHRQALPGSLLVAPLTAGRRTVGTLCFGFTSPRRFDDTVRALIGALRAQATAALERAQAFQTAQEASREAQRARQEAEGDRKLAEGARRLAESSLAQAQEAISRIERLQSLTAQLSAAVSEEAVTTIICREGVQALGAKIGIIYHLDSEGEGLRLAGAYGLSDEQVAKWPPLAMSEATPVTEAVAARQPVCIETTAVWQQRYPHLASRPWLAAGARMALPLEVSGRVIGCLAYVWSDDRAFSETDRQFAASMAAQAAQAVERARLYRQSEEGVRMRDEFLSMASHELRTPLTSLKLQLDSLCRQFTGDAVAHVPVKVVQPKLQRLVRQADRMAKLIQELLDVARVSQGRLPLDIEAVDLREVVREVADRHAEELSRQRCALWLQCAPAVGAWDRSRLDQVVTNLLSNALKYGAGKPITITTTVEGQDAVLTVKDQGIGIAAENHQRVFERFERVVSSSQGGGFGIGLWIVAEVVHAFGGHITVDSAPGTGAAFIVRLPLQPPVSAVP